MRGNNTSTNRFIAFYLPQYYPIPENDKWYGKGFTEWTNVAKAKPLFRGHYEPHIPSELGFYDMRNPNTIKEQAKLASEYGIEGFCYWHYWFGNGKKLLNEPFEALVADKSIDISFCLSWANGTWLANKWNGDEKRKVIVEQNYPGEEDIRAHFYELLPAFGDSRYIRVDDKPVFCIHEPDEIPNLAHFISLWQQLARKEGLKGFYFVAKDFYCRNVKSYLKLGFDATYEMNTTRIHHEQNLFTKLRLMMQRKILKMPSVFEYSKAIDYMLQDEEKDEHIIPVIAPNWDHSPRSGRDSIILKNCEPRYFKRLVKRVISMIASKPAERRIVFIQSWNEWGEGNHLEPDLKYQRGYLEALAEAINEKR